MPKTVAITAYAPGKLLEQGNAERVNRAMHFSSGNPPVLVAAASPFVLSDFPLVHPALIAGTGTVTDNAWWQLVGAAAAGNPYVVPGDQFTVVASVFGWQANMKLTQLLNTTMHVINVINVGNDMFIQTAEAPVLATANGALNHLNPWFRGSSWESLVTSLVNETNAALVLLGTDPADLLSVNVSNLPLLNNPVGSLVATFIASDVPLNHAGVCRCNYAGQPALAWLADNLAEVLVKDDVLSPTDTATIAGPFKVWSSVAGGSYDASGPSVTGLHSAHVAAPGFYPDFNTQHVLVGPVGQQQFAPPPNYLFTANTAPGTQQFWKATHACSNVSSIINPAGTNTYYEIYSKSVMVGVTGHFGPSLKQGIQITKHATTDGGKTWGVPDAHNDFTQYDPADQGTPFPSVFWAGLGAVFGQSWRPSIKVAQLSGAGNSFLYCWTDPVQCQAYLKTATTDTQASTFFFPRPTGAGAPFTSFAANAPCRSSSMVHTKADGTNFDAHPLFFCDRFDGGGVDLYYWNGTTLVLATINDTTGTFASFSPLTGGDFINAMVDVSRTPNKLYIVVQKTCYAIGFSWSAPTFTVESITTVDLDVVNFDMALEQQSEAAINNPNAIVNLTGPILQDFPGETDFLHASDSLIVANYAYTEIVSDQSSSSVQEANFSGMSCAEALQDLLVLRGYQMLTGADQDMVPDPTVYSPISTVSFKQRLLPNSTPVIDLVLDDLNEACQDGVWMLNYSAISIGNSKGNPILSPVFNLNDLITIDGVQYTISIPRYPGQALLAIDNPFINTISLAQLLANFYANEFVIPRTSATIVCRDPWVLGAGGVLQVLDLIKFTVKGPDNYTTGTFIGQGRIMSIDYGLEAKLLTIKTA